MAKTKKAAKRGSKAMTGEEQVSIGFVGEVIDRAIADLKAQYRDLPTRAEKARGAVNVAISSLEVTKNATKMHCGGWVMPIK